MSDFLTHLRQQLSDPFPARGQVLVACSGGPDSVLLAWGLQALGLAGGLAHVNYQLRGEESAADEALVRQLAERWQLPCYVKKASLSPDQPNLQAEARQLRYAFFEAIMAEQGLAFTATAHQADDQVETLLKHLLRGNSPELLAPIPLRRGPYLRPLLALTKDDILAELARQNLPYRLDASNQKPDYERNRIRLELLPLLRTFNPRIEAHLLERLHWYQQQQAGLTAWLDQALASCLVDEPDGPLLSWEAWASRDHASQLPLLVTHALSRWGLHGHLLWQAAALHTAAPGKTVAWNEGQILRTRRGLKWLKQDDPLPLPAPFVLQAGEGTLDYHDHRISWQFPFRGSPDFGRPEVLLIDAGTLAPPLQWRPWQQGDRMQPLGMRGSKKLSDILVDEKFTASQKQRALVLEDQEGIVALAGFRIAERVKLRPHTQQVLRLVTQREK